MSIIERGNILFINTQGSGLCFEKIDDKWQALGWSGDLSDLLNSYRLLLIALTEHSRSLLSDVNTVREVMPVILDSETQKEYAKIVDYCETKNQELIVAAQETILQTLDFMTEAGIPIHDFQDNGAMNAQEKANQDFVSLLQRLDGASRNAGGE